MGYGMWGGGGGGLTRYAQHSHTQPRWNASSTRAPVLALTAARRTSPPPPLDSRLGEKSSQLTPHHRFHWMKRRTRRTRRTTRTKRRRGRKVVMGSASHRSVYGRIGVWSVLPRERPSETHWSSRVCCSGGRGRYPRGPVSYHRPTGPVGACVSVHVCRCVSRLCKLLCKLLCNRCVYRQRSQSYIMLKQ
jgi:hypothetical protein